VLVFAAALRVMLAVVLVIDLRYGRTASLQARVLVDRLAGAVGIRVACPPIIRIANLLVRFASDNLTAASLLPAAVGVVVRTAVGIIIRHDTL
jgi:hypothetical protein